MRNETVATAGGRKGLPKACTGTAVERLKEGRVETAEAQESSAAGVTEGTEARADAAKEAEGPGRAKEILVDFAAFCAALVCWLAKVANVNCPPS